MTSLREVYFVSSHVFAQHSKYSVVNISLLIYTLSVFLPKIFVLRATPIIYGAYSMRSLLNYGEILFYPTSARTLSSPTLAIKNNVYSK